MSDWLASTVWRLRLLVCVLGTVAALPVLLLREQGDREFGDTDVPDSTPRTDEAALLGLAGAEACAECHAAEYESHVRTGHARSFARTRDSQIAQSICGRSVDASDPYGRYEYLCDESGLAVILPDKFGDRALPLEFAVGSGDHAVTFLSLVRDQSGATIGVEHRRTWYRSLEGLGVTPGQQRRQPHSDVEEFGRVYRLGKADACIDCHTTSATIVGHSLQNLVEGVQCEECHGPGADHIDAARSGRIEELRTSVAMPRNLAEEVALCGRCHRMPADIEGDRLEDYPDELKRFQPVGLLRSRCYTESAGHMGCTTCHNPHAPVAAAVPASHVAACRSCHQSPADAKCPVSPEQGCIPCHMPAQELFPGVSFHDHWIRRTPVVSGRSPLSGR